MVGPSVHLGDVLDSLPGDVLDSLPMAMITYAGQSSSREKGLILDTAHHSKEVNEAEA